MKKKMLGIAIGMAAVFAMTGCSGQGGESPGCTACRRDYFLVYHGGLLCGLMRGIYRGDRN